MYVCICNAITDRDIRRAAADGADNLYALQSRLGVAAGCGSCADHAREILREGHAKQPARPPTLYVPVPA
ncbi:MAG: bacterioferritin-associated ferredoxin [Woeseia sp.]|nr:bacterioferritin-associated ferredoxin [Woeseia sp.]NNE59365.1 bacterioferritin-associated ferredoxin [Woeseia sp.]